MLAAVTLVLAPQGADHQPPSLVAFFFLAGALAFLGLDEWLAKRKTSASQFIAMLSDFLPEALALGATFAHSRESGVLLALLIAIQNVPESFNAFRELRGSMTVKASHLIIAFAMMVPLGPLAGLAGFWFLSELPSVYSAVMLFAGGGILYIIFQDVAPQVPLENRWAPPLGAVLGFLAGFIGDLLLHP